ncbi:MAG: universal stress protein [Chloroflexi bacterium]|nr:universal stress protein [Chloroflexota bacterium]
MGLILCATRGGEASLRTQNAAISLAKERGDELAFLYIVDLEFLNKTAAPIMVDVENELAELGNFLLIVAKERANEEGVKTQTLSRKGNVREEIKKAAVEINATLVVLGRPEEGSSAFQLSNLHTFADEIKDETGVEAHII